jgi:hypothetical protein
VEVRSKSEILATLDKSGRLEGLPFMPEMFRFCGRQFRVYKSAHKTCDTATLTGGRHMKNAVHLEGLRCSGEAHGGCQAACLIFWKEVWLKRVSTDPAAKTPSSEPSKSGRTSQPGTCAEADVLAGTRANSDSSEPRYACQATELPRATTRLPHGKISQYVADYTSGNVSLPELFQGGVYAIYYMISQGGFGLGKPMRWSYDKFQHLRGGRPYPRKRGIIEAGSPTPSRPLDLQPGELVKVKSYKEILATLDTKNKNRGLLFDAEMVPFCDKTFRVLRRVNHIIDEKTGKMINIKSDTIILDNVFCKSLYSDCKYTPLFCPRSIYSYWREIWLERVPQEQQNTANSPVAQLKS